MDDPTKPPCVCLGQPLNWCAQQQMAEKILGHVFLPGEWQGWRFRGRDLVSPDGIRVNPERLRGMLFRERIQNPEKKKKTASSKVVQLKLFEDERPDKGTQKDKAGFSRPS